MKSSNKKTKIRIYKTSCGYSFYDSSASSMSANLRGYTDLLMAFFDAENSRYYTNG